MLRKPKTITRDVRHPKSLKPQKARQLIRRFHTLEKWKRAVLRFLAALNPEISDQNYRQVLGAEYKNEISRWKKKVAKNPVENVQIDHTTGRAELINTLAGIDCEEEFRGGLHVYQMASTVGQDTTRGGDSSKWLVKVVTELKISGIKNTLEIGSLSVENCISRDGRFGTVCRIDLNSQHPRILQQDFMDRPLPQSDNGRFEMVSCSLVLNFVPDAVRRYEMLLRITRFLLPGGHVFLVLPLPCVENSRYMDAGLLTAITQSLGLHQRKTHSSSKLYYALYQWSGEVEAFEYRKKELRSGKTRNNFYIDCRGSTGKSEKGKE